MRSAKFLRWGQSAFDEFKVVPPGTGIVHQVNIESLARVVVTRNGQAYPTPASERLPTRRWSTDSASLAGVSEASRPRRRCLANLCRCSSRGLLASSCPGEPVGRDCHGSGTHDYRTFANTASSASSSSSTARVSSVPLANRATIGNMSPEYGSTAAIFLIDAETVRYLKLTGRRTSSSALVEAYRKRAGARHDPAATTYSENLELDWSTVVPSPAGPSAPRTGSR